MSLEILFGAIYVFSAAVSLWSLTQLNRFLAETRDIADNICLDRYKALVRLQMYLALFMMVLLLVGIVVGMAMIARHGLLGILAVILTNMLVLGLGLYHKSVEVKARTLRTASEVLAKEYQRVSETWVKKPLPDF